MKVRMPDGQRLNPAGNGFGIDRVLQPAQGVGDQIEEDRTEQPAQNQFKKTGPRAKPLAQPDDDRVNGVIQNQPVAERADVVIKNVQGDIGDQHDSEREPPFDGAAKIHAGAERKGVGDAEIPRHQSGDSRQSEYQDEDGGQQNFAFHEDYFSANHRGLKSRNSGFLLNGTNIIASRKN